MSLLDSLGAYLEAQGVGTLGTDLFLGYLPDTPDSAVVLVDTGGGEASLVDKIDTPSWQVRIRSSAYPDAMTKALAVMKALHGVTESDLGPTGSTTHFHLIWAIQNPVSLGRDGKERHELAQNYRAFWDNPDR